MKLPGSGKCAGIWFLRDTVDERNAHEAFFGKMDLLYRGNTDSHPFGISGRIYQK